MNVITGLDAFARERHLSLETFRRNGSGVRTPVWFAAAPDGPDAGTLYVYSRADAGKVKRIRLGGAVRIAPCTGRGRITGAWVDARAEIAGPEAFARGMRLIDRKYWPVKQVLDLGTRLFSRHQRAMVAIRLT